MAELVRRDLPLVLFIVVVIWMFFEFFIQIPYGGTITGYLGAWLSIVATFALLLGALNMIRLHGKNFIQMRKGEWYHSALILSTMFLMFFSGFIYKPIFNWLYDNIFYGLQAALMCYVGFYYFSAMYRTFRARSIEAVALLISAIGMLFANAPVSSMIWRGLPVIGMWLAEVPGMGAWRGFLMAAALGVFAMAIRTLLGLERSYLGEPARE